MASYLYRTVIPYEVFSAKLHERQEEQGYVPPVAEHYSKFERFLGQIVTHTILIAGAVRSALSEQPCEVVPITAAKSYQSYDVADDFGPSSS